MNTLSTTAWRGWPAAMVLTASLCTPASTVRAEDPKGEAAKPPRVRTETVRRGDMDMIVRAIGTLEPEEVVDVGAQVAGTIKRFGDDPSQPQHQIYWNSKVEVGTVLAYIDDAPYKAAVEIAKANLKKARAGVRGARAALKKATAEYERSKQQLATRTVPQAVLEAGEFAFETATANAEIADAQVEMNEAELKQAEGKLENTRIQSPIKGIILDRRANVGQRVEGNLNGASLFLIAKDLSKLQLWMSVGEADIAEIQKGQSALFTVEARPEKLYEGQVDQIRLNATANQNVVTYTVVVSVDNAKGELLPYGTATAAIKVGRRTNVLMAPNAALSWCPDSSSAPTAAGTSQTPPPDKSSAKANRHRVWVQEGKSTRPIEVKLGASNGTMTEITGGDLKEGMQVVVGESADN